MRASIHSSFLLPAIASLALAGGCASSAQKPVEQLTQARTLIEQAERGGAQQYAAADLEQARGKLSRAEAASEEGDHEASLRLAREATADAELAQAKSSAAEARNSQQELEQSLEALRNEADRAPATGSPDRP
jgi:hypothetical protein